MLIPVVDAIEITTNFHIRRMATSLSTAKKVTPSDTRRSVFDHPIRLSCLQLPTKEDVYRCYMWHMDAAQQKGKPPSTREITKPMANEVVAIWNKAGIPTMDYSSVVQSLNRLIDSGKELQKYPAAKRTSETFQSKESAFKELFDICPCKCFNKGIAVRSVCRCTTKIPLIEWEFWIDQNSQEDDDWTCRY